MKEATGDLWSFPAEYRCVTTNGVVTSAGELVMGAGVAKQAKIRFPHLPRVLGEYVRRWGNRAFILKQERVITLPTKDDWRRPSDLRLITRSLKQLVAIADKYGVRSVALSRPGCGNGGLDWQTVGAVCHTLLDDRFTVVSLEEKKCLGNGRGFTPATPPSD